MKKLVAMFATGIMIVGAAATSVSAEEYEVKQGDSLWSIANDNNTTIDELVDINGLNTTVIQPKDTIIINEETEEVYEVEQGDTLSSIAKEFDLSVNNIKKWNNLSSDLIVVGQELDMNGANVTEEAPANDKEQTQSEAAEPKTTEVSNEDTEESTPAKKETKETKEKPKSEQTSEETSNQANQTEESPEGKTISVTSTAYTAECDGCSGVTSTGDDLNANPDAKVIAVDPNVIPLGSEVYVEGYGYATAADTGSAIKGNKIDVHIPSKDEALGWGSKTVNVTIVE